MTNAASGASRSRSRVKTSTPAAGSTKGTRSPTRSDRDTKSSSKAVAEKFARLGIARELDFALHLPLRYDDETRIYAINEAPAGRHVVVQGRVIDVEVKYRPRRQLVCHLGDGTGVLSLRFFNFYPSQTKQLARDVFVRVSGEIRQGFFGAEIVHPRYKVVSEDAPLPASLTPVYPSTE